MQPIERILLGTAAGLLALTAFGFLTLEASTMLRILAWAGGTWAVIWTLTTIPCWIWVRHQERVMEAR